jgi:zinc protease
VPNGLPRVFSPPGDKAGPIAIIDRPSALQAELLVGYPTPGASHADYEALEMLASLLGDSVGGRLFHDLRERQGLAYIIGAKVSPEGRLAAVTQARHERVVALVRGIEAHFEALVRQPLLACETDRLVQRFRGALLLESSRPDERSSRLHSDWALRGGPLSEAERRRRIEAAAAELDRVARRFLSGPPRIVIVGDAEWLERDLSQAFPERPIEIYDAAAAEGPRRTRAPRSGKDIEEAPH